MKHDPQSAEARRTAHFNATAALITELWGTMPVRRIAARVGSSSVYISRVARMIGLPADASPVTPKGEAASTMPRPKPLRPRGFTPEQILWARHHRHLPEALMILGPIGEATGLPACQAYCRDESNG
jgi:hypothetical protein